MSQSFPTSQPSYPDTSATEVLGSAGSGKGLSNIIDDYGLDITGITTKMGTGATTPTLNKVLVGDGTGTSTWGTTLAGLTLTTPTIASFTNATHTHQNAAGGGTLAESALATTDITTNDVTTSKHGFVPKAPNLTTKYLRGDATWSSVTNSYPIVMTFPASSPADSTTYYGASYTGVSAVTTEGSIRYYVQIAGTIVSGYTFVGNVGTAGTNETSTLAFRLNNTTDTILTAALTTSAQPGTLFTHSSINVAVAVGDYLELKWATPAWVTNPTNLLIQTYLLVQ